VKKLRKENHLIKDRIYEDKQSAEKIETEIRGMERKSPSLMRQSSIISNGARTRDGE
jgi:hypothetical protein